MLELAHCELSSDAAQLTASGKVDRWSKDRAIELAGKADYDLEKLAIVLQPYIRGEIRDRTGVAILLALRPGPWRRRRSHSIRARRQRVGGAVERSGGLWLANRLAVRF